MFHSKCYSRNCELLILYKINLLLRNTISISIFDKKIKKKTYVIYDPFQYKNWKYLFCLKTERFKYPVFSAIK